MPAEISYSLVHSKYGAQHRANCAVCKRRIKPGEQSVSSNKTVRDRTRGLITVSVIASICASCAHFIKEL